MQCFLACVSTTFIYVYTLVFSGEKLYEAANFLSIVWHKEALCVQPKTSLQEMTHNDFERLSLPPFLVCHLLMTKHLNFSAPLDAIKYLRSVFYASA